MIIKYGLLETPNYRGGLPDPPEPPECDGEFRSDVCEGCSDYEECAREDYERSCDVTHILENMV